MVLPRSTTPLLTRSAPPEPARTCGVRGLTGNGTSVALTLYLEPQHDVSCGAPTCAVLSVPGEVYSESVSYVGSDPERWGPGSWTSLFLGSRVYVESTPDFGST